MQADVQAGRACRAHQLAQLQRIVDQPESAFQKVGVVANKSRNQQAALQVYQFRPLMTANGYNDNIPLGNNPSISGFAFGGDSNGFLTTRANLSPLAGNTARLRFRFSSDIASGGEGWYIDDVVLASNPDIVTNTVDFSLAKGCCIHLMRSSPDKVTGCFFTYSTFPHSFPHLLISRFPQLKIHK